MKSVFIEAKWIGNIEPVIKKSLKSLPKKVGLVATVQHKHELKKIKKIIEDNGKEAVIGGQILGCDVSVAKKIMKEIDAFLYIGSGEFHPIGVAMETNKRIIAANPINNSVSEIKQKDIDKYKNRHQGALIKFLSAKIVGVLVSLKPGQEKLKKAFELKKKYKDKEFYIFVSDTINLDEMDNFNFIQAWVNTACPRIADDKAGILNYEMLEK